MKKSAYHKDILRTITRGKKRFCSIAIITMLGVIMFTGLRAGCVDLRKSADVFFDQQNLYDIAVQSTLGLTDEDVEVLAALDGVEAAEGAYSETVSLSGETHESVLIKTISPSGMNALYVIEGTLPQEADEIAVTEIYLSDTGKSIGDTVTIEEMEDEDGDEDDEDAEDEDGEDEDVTFEITEYTITAVVTDPADINNAEGSIAFRDTSTTDYTFFVLPEAVNSDIYTAVYLTVSGAAELNCYSDAYDVTVSAVIDDIESELKEQREKARTEEVLEEAQSEIDDAEAEMNESFAEAEQELADAWEELEEGLEELDDGWEEYEDGLSQIEEAQDELDEGILSLEEEELSAEEQIAAAKAELVSGRAEIAAGWEEITENEALLSSSREELEAGAAQLENTEAETEAQIAAGWAEIEEYQVSLEATLEELEMQAAQAQEQLGDAWQEEEFNALRQTAAAGGDTTAAATALSETLQTALSPTITLLQTQIDSLSSAIRALSDAGENVTSEETEQESDESDSAAVSSVSAVKQGEMTFRLTSRTDSGDLIRLSADSLTGDAGVASDGMIEEDLPVASTSNADAGGGSSEDDMALDTGDDSTEESASDTGNGSDGDESSTDGSEDSTGESSTDGSEDNTGESSTDGSEDSTGDTSSSLDSEDSSSGDTESSDGTDTVTADEASSTVANLQTQLAALQAQLEALNTLINGVPELAIGLGQIDAGLAELELQSAALLEQEAEAEAQFAAAWQTIDESMSQLAAAQEQIVNARAQLISAQAQLDEGEATLAEQEALAEEEIEAAWETIREGQKEIDEALAELADARVTLEEAEEEYEDGLEEYRSGLEEYQDEEAKAEEELAEAKAELADLDTASWYVQDRSSLSGYSNVESDSGAIESIGTVFPVIFLAVAILISLTTITRMVEEERSLIGAYKALGFTDAEIRRKYLIFALAACLAGSAVGELGGFIVLPEIIFIFFRVMYVLPFYTLYFDVLYGMLGPAIFLVGVGAATWLACRAAVRKAPAVLMRPKTPRAGSRVFLEKIPFLWNRFSFLNKVTARNLFRYKKRMIMTVAGILGCTALLVCGYAIKDSVTELADLQYHQVYQYDVMAVASDYDDLLAIIEESEDVESWIGLYIDSVTVEYEDSTESVQLIVVPDEDAEELADYIKMTDKAGTAYTPADDGILITINAGEVTGFSAGDTVTVQDLTLASGDFEVTALVMNYMGNNIYMTQSVYETVFGEYEPNGVFANLNDSVMDTTSWADDLAHEDGITSVTSVQQLYDEFAVAFVLINVVVYVIIVLAAALAFVVLFTLSTTNISEREREIATIKVLGFYDREVHLYVNKETLILTVLGILPGLVGGTFLGNGMTILLKLPSIYFAVTIFPVSYLISGGLAFLFALIVQQITNRVLNTLNPVEALKSVE